MDRNASRDVAQRFRVERDDLELGLRMLLGRFPQGPDPAVSRSVLAQVGTGLDEDLPPAGIAGQEIDFKTGLCPDVVDRGAPALELKQNTGLQNMPRFDPSCPVVDGDDPGVDRIDLARVAVEEGEPPVGDEHMGAIL